jgi:hypothetical protein
VTRPWRVAGALLVLLNEVNKRWPDRDKASDGTIGNAAHVAEGWTDSDHNPWVVDANGNGVVRALDVDAGPGLNPDNAHDTIGQTVADAAVAAGKAGHPAMGDGSYVIWHGQIASVNSVPPWSWRPFDGDPHTSHPHVSVTTHQAGYDSTKPWGIWPVEHRHTARKRPTLWRSKAKAPRYRDDVKDLQRRLGITPDGVWGPVTSRLLRAFRRHHKLRPWRTAVAGPAVWKFIDGKP